MAHSLARIWLHIVFTTKGRQPLISAELESKLYEVIKQEASSMDCHLDKINGMPDHIHLLIQLHPSKSLADFIKQIKGASSYQVNQNDWISDKFGWQKGYGAFSVSKSQLSNVRRYIDNQKIHHQKMDAHGEWNRLLELHDLN